ncbi:MAG TPA: NHL repeat-containing protein, partial [Candidatus Binataceae bacterium]|nr:NHL repeat-containing protein [Candidatus Binataceae bacterium]
MRKLKHSLSAMVVAGAVPCMLALAVVIAIAGTPGSAGDTTADLVLGQTDFTHTGANHLDATALQYPAGAAVDSAGHLYVADKENNRVLGYLSADSFSNGAAADLVIGQPDFVTAVCNDGTGPGDVSGYGPDSLCNPYGVAVDSNKNLYVADFGNSRVLEYTDPFASCASFPCVGAPANLVFGQGGSFTAMACNNGGVSASSLCEPFGVALDGGGRLYIADYHNNRVLEFDTPLASQTANRVFGQGGSFTSSTCNNGGATATSLCNPEGVAVDGGGDLYIADYYNSRVLEFDTPLTSQTANRVFGQAGSFTSSTCNNGGVSATSLCYPAGVAADGTGRLYILDWANNRVIEFDTPLTSQSASRAFGQGSSLTAGSCNNGGVSAASLCYPDGVAVDGGGHLYIVDENNNRVLEFDNPLASQTAQRELGQPDFTRNGINRLDLAGGAGLNYPSMIAVDGAGHLYIVDLSNNRVLGYRNAPAFTDGQAADVVFGQPDFISGDCNDGTGLGDSNGVGPDSLCDPAGVAVDPSNNLYVVDVNNNRVLEYNDPFASCASFPCVGAPANRVFGQGGSFTAGACDDGSAPGDVYGVGPDSLCYPEGAAVDGGGHLYIADEQNSRVLEFDNPLTGQTANRVFGQDGSFTTNGCNDGTAPGDVSGLGPDSLCYPYGVAVDGGGRLYIADSSNDRVPEFDSPLTSQSASRVFGQGGSFTTSNSGTSATALSAPMSVAVDVAGHLYVADWNNNRVLEFDTPLTSQSANRVFGQGGNFTTWQCNPASADSLCEPMGVAADSSANLYVADGNNNRV